MHTLSELSFSVHSLDYLFTLPSSLRSQLIKKAKVLATNSAPPKSKQLKGIKSDAGEPVRRVRSGDYRILYVVRNSPKGVVVLDIGHRKDVYK